MLLSSLIHFVLIFLCVFLHTSYSESSQLYTACNNLDDGVQWIRPFVSTQENGEEYPNIQVRCSEGWTILDYSLDSEITKYFSSFTSWTEYAASSSLDDRVTWSDWFLPTTETTKFRVSEDCQTCSSSDDLTDYSAYFMTGNYIGCLWVTKGMCDMDTSSLECYECETSKGKTYSGLCTHMELLANTEVYVDHDLCTTNSFNIIPALGTNGKYCVCYQPEEAVLVDAGTTFARDVVVDEEQLTADSVIELTSADFNDGTYRITKSGYYKLMEDIELNMNVPDDYDSPNAEGAWYPQVSQSEYEGADGSFVGAYSMGFFTAFAIETDDVTIDLNGYELKMSKEFHLQQRWFSLIEIGSKAFISGQGPGNFGAFLSTSSNIVIKNGVLGLTSHHGIHGNSASDITIQDLTIKDFEVGGIALNGFTNLLIQDVEIGPSYTDVPVLGVYTQARVMLPRLRKVAEENPDKTVTFYGRAEENRDLSMLDIEEGLERQMDAIFAHFIQGKEYEDSQTVWSRAKELFVNENKVPSASTVYGIFLNSLGASVFAVGSAPGLSYNAVIKNVKIHDLINDPWEVPRLLNVKGPFNDIVDVTRITDNSMTDLTSAEYKGTAYSDAQYALHELTDSWSILSHSAFTDDVTSWISNGKSLTKHSVKLQCNNDIMLHVTKGVFGMRIDNIDNLQIDNVQIEDLQNIGYYGSWICGHYSSEDNGGHRNQRSPMQYGYTGTEIHGIAIINSKGTIDNLSINKIISARGDAAGLRLYPGNEFTLGTISISDIHAGAYAKSSDLLLNHETHLPNKLPRACGIDSWTYSDDSDDTLSKNVITYDASKISVSCLTYMTECSWDYSNELTSNVIQECLKENGNLFDTEDLVNFESVYHAIEASNVDTYSGVVNKLQTQDENNEGGANMIPVSDTDTDSSADVPVWIYVIVVVIIVMILGVVIFRKCISQKQREKKENAPNSSMSQRISMHNYNTMTTENTPLISQQL